MEKMQLNNKVQHVYLVGAKSLGAYGGYETFVYKLTEYHQNKDNIKYQDVIFQYLSLFKIIKMYYN